MADANDDGGGVTVAFREAGPGDVALVAQLWSHAFDDTFRWVLGADYQAFLEGWLKSDPGLYKGTSLAYVGESPAGYVQVRSGKLMPSGRAWPLLCALRRRYGLFPGIRRALQLALSEAGNFAPRHNAHIYMLGVHPDWRRRGVGWKLLEHAEALGSAAGKAVLSLGVVDDNWPAIRLYERFGFRRVRHVSSRLIHWSSGCAGYYDMRKSLS